MPKERSLKRKLQRKNEQHWKECKKEGKSAEDRFIDG
jgi:post-segregation antitoxin (ccd killing protein)